MGKFGGSKNGKMEQYMGREVEQTVNNNGKRIIEIWILDNLIIANTKFKHKTYTNIREYARIGTNDQLLTTS